MNIIKLSKYGRVLTGRQFGKQVREELLAKISCPVALDFEGVAALGSSFGGEIIPVIAFKQNRKIQVYNVSSVVWECLEDIAKDNDIELIRS